MNRTIMLPLFLCLLLTVALHAQNLSGALNDAGFVVLSGEEKVTLVGFELQSASGLLIPVPDDNAQPFQLLLANDASQIAYAAPSEPVVMDGELVLGVGYSGSLDDFVSDVTGVWGGPLDDVGGPISISIPDVRSGILPEPSAIQMIFVGALVLSQLRQKKRLNRPTQTTSGFNLPAARRLPSAS